MSETPPPPAPGYQQQPQQPYGQQPYAPYGTTPYGAPLGPRTNGLAIAALILGLTTWIGGIIAGHIALGQIKRTGEEGRGLALAGLIIGYVGCGFLVLYIIGMIILLVVTLGTAGVMTQVN